MKNHYDYVVTLKRPDFKIFDRISLLLCVLAIGFFSYYIVNGINSSWKYFIVIVVVLLQLVYNYFQRKKNKEISYWGAFFLIAVGFLILPVIGITNLITALLFIISAFLEKQIKFPKEIGLDNDGLTFNSLPKKFVQWSAVSNAVLKDGLITIDYKNNKLFQKEIQEQVSAETEKEFNEFCKSNLHWAVSSG